MKKQQGKFRDLTGETFGHLHVIKRVESDGKGARWLCECACSKMKIAKASLLVAGLQKSCGWNCGLRVRRERHCAECGEAAPIVARNLCAPCYEQWYAKRLPTAHIPVPEREPWTWPGDENALAAMTAAQENAK